MTADLLVMRIAHWLRHDQVDARIALRVLDRSGQLSFEILFQDKSVADRTFAVLPRDCAARRDAFALAVSLALDNVVQRREQIAAEIAAESVAPSTPVTAATTTAVTATAAPAAATPERRVELGFSLSAAVLVHGLPGVSALGGVAVELSDGLWMGRLGVLASTQASAGFAGGEVATRLLGGRADLCLIHPLSTLAMIGCVGLQAGAVHMQGREFMRSETSVQAWLSGSGQLALEWPRDLLRARVFVEPVIPLLSPAARVVDSDGGTLEKLTTVRAGVILGVSVLVVFR